MKEQTTGIKIAKRVLAWTLSAFLVVTMIPSLGFMAAGTGAKDPTGSTAKAAIPANGEGWTASGNNGLKYFQAIYGNGNEISSWSWNTELSSGVYYVKNNITLQPDANNTRPRESALRIKAGADVKIIILDNKTLTLTGGNAVTYNGTYKQNGNNVTNTSNGGAGAGIYLPSGSKLTIDGQGTIIAKGGNAAAGQAGENSPNSSSRGAAATNGVGITPSGSSTTYSGALNAGGGGYGGYGGGGAGAGIGTSGGAGGSRGSYGSGTISTKEAATSGAGGSGSSGSNSSASGELIQYGNVTISASGGAGANGGGTGNVGTYMSGISGSWSYMAGASGGSGGGGGGGLPGNKIGSGGPGGGGGGGGSGGIAGGRMLSKAVGGTGGSAGGGYVGTSATVGKAGSGSGGSGNAGYAAGSTFTSNNGYYSGGSARGGNSVSCSANITKKFTVTAGNGGAGGRSGQYGSNGAITSNKLSAANTNQRITLNGYTCGSRGNAYYAYPERELVMTLNESTAADRGPAEKNPDGETWAYKGGTNHPVKPVINLKHVPTGATLSNSTAFAEKYDNAGGAVTATNSVQAIAKAESKGLTSNASSAVMTDSNYKDRDGNNNLYTITMNYTIDYPSFTVKMDACGGTNSTTITCKKGAAYPSVGTVVTPVREGYTFGGYYTQKNGEGTQYFKNDCSAAKSTWDIGENTTLYAKWVPTKYKVKFFAEFGEGAEYIPYEGTGSTTLSDGSKVMESTYGALNLPTAHDLGISRPHYDFIGWNIYEDQDWAMYKADKTYKAGLTTNEGEIVNIYVAWRAKDMLNVSYDANGGTAAPPVDGTWADSDYTIPKQKPVRPGYAFTGWNTVAAPTAEEPGIAYQPEETAEAGSAKGITKSVTLYAQWERNHTVAYKTNGGMVTNGELVTEYPDTGSNVDVNYTAELTRTGYDFIGWRVGNTNKVYTQDTPEQSTITVDGEELQLEKKTEFEMPNSNVVLYAQWVPQKMDVDYLADDLYVYDGWRYGDKDGNVDWDSKIPPTGQKVEYDKPLEFSVVIDSDKVDDSAMRLRINGVNLEPVKVENSTGVKNTTTYFYKVDKVRGGQMISVAGLAGQTYPVILDAQDGDLVGNVTNHTFGTETALPIQATDIKDDEGEVIKAADIPVKKGFKFEGWFENSEGTGDAVETISATTMPNSADGKSVNFYAKWTEGKYSIEFVTGALPDDPDSIYAKKYDESIQDYEDDIAGFTDIGYSVKKNLPNLGAYVDYKYMEPDEQDPEQEVEKTATFMGWAFEKDAAEADFAPGMAIRRLSDEDDAKIKLYPVWGAPHYTVVLDANGGKMLASITGYQARQEIDLPGAEGVAREGYDFDGWYDTKTPAAGAVPVTKISRDDVGKKVYYANWIPKQYRYKLQGVNTETGQAIAGEVFESGDQTVGEDTATLSKPDEITVPDGKKLAGWTESYTYDEEEEAAYPDEMIYMADEEVSDLWKDSEGKFTAMRTLYPVWVDADSNTLTYDANGGEGEFQMIEAKATDPVTVFSDEIMIPSRIGYKFLGWSEDKNWDESSDKTLYTQGGDPSTITLDTSKKLYAIWEVLEYDITFDANLGADAGKEGVGFEIKEGGQTTYAETVKQHVGSYEEEVALAPVPEEPTRGNLYEFLGWSTMKHGAVEYQNGSKISGFADMEVEDGHNVLKGRTLYAVWMVKGPTYLSFDANGGTGAPAMETYPKGTENIDVSANASGRVKPTRHGYTFEGWQTLDATDPENPVYTDVTSIDMPDTEAESITLYAKWKVEPGLNIVYQHNDSIGSTPTDVKTYYKGEEAYVLYRPAPTKGGYTFDGWDVDGTEIQLRTGDQDSEKLALDEDIFDIATPVGDSLVQIYLKAHFKANEYRVTFDANGGTGDVPEDIEKTYDTSVGMPGAPDRLKAPKGFAFVGWSESPEGSGTIYEEGDTNWDLSNADEDSVTLYAVYEASETNAKFDNGDKGTITKKLKYDEALPDFDSIPEKTGYEFDGYYMEEDGEKVYYYNSSMEALRKWDKTSEDLEEGQEAFEMKAEWKPQTYTISYHDTNGVLVDSREITYGEGFRTANDADLTVPTGYRHIGWNLKNDPDQTVPDFEADKTVVPTKDNGLYNNGQTVTVYAVYQEIRKFNVNYDANGGTDAPQDNKKYEQGDTVSVSFEPVPTRANYDFLGWTTYSNTQSVLPGGVNEGKYYGDAGIDGVESVDGKRFHYGDTGASDTEREMSFQIKNDTKFYAVWVHKTYYTVEFFGNPTSNGGTGEVTGKAQKFNGPDNRSYTRSESNDSYKTDDVIYRSTSPYKGDTSTKIKLPDGTAMFNNSDEDARFMGWAKASDAKVAEHAAGEELEDITMDENVVFNAVWAHPVRSITLTDIEEPVYENAPSEDVEATSGSGVNVTKSTWSPSTDQFAVGTKYKLSVKMKAQDGFYFNTEKKPEVKLNYKDTEGQDQIVTVRAEDVTFNPEGNLLTAVYTFAATENIIVNGDKDTDKEKAVPVTGVTAPEAGKKLVTVGNVGDVRVDENSKYAGITWSAKDATTGETVAVSSNAQPNTIYMATLRVKPAKGYEFKTDTTKVTFSGETVPTVVDAETGELIVTYEFPATAKIDNDINLKLNGKLRNNQNLPDQTFTSADNVDKDSRMADITWFKGGSEVDVDKHKVTPNTKYVAQVVLKPASGYTFDTQTIVTFGGDQLEVQPKGTHPEGNDWAVLQSDGSVLVSHEFTSSGDVLLEIATAGTISADYGAAAAELELPGEVTITSEEGKRDADVAWIYGDELDKFKVVDGEGNVTEQSISDVLKSTDAEKRKGYTVKLQGAVTIPEGITVPDEMQPTVTTINVKIGEDPRLALEAQAEALEERAAEAIARAENIENPSEEVTRLVAALREKLDEMDQYKDNLEVSTPLGLEEKIMAAERALTDLQVEIAEIPTINILMLGDLTIGDPMPDRMYSTDVRIASTSHVPEITWAPNDKRVVEHQTYSARIRMEVAENGLVKEGGTVTFPDGKVLTIGAAAVDNELAELIHDHELGKDFLVVRRNYTSDKLILRSIADPEGLTVGWGTAPTNVKLPKTLEATTDHDKRDLAVEWIDGEGKVKVVEDSAVNEKDFAAVLSDKNNREEHQVVLETEVAVPERITNPDGSDPENPHVDTTKRITITIEADPRLVPESEAADLQSENGRATKALADAQAKMDSLGDETDPYYQRIKAKKEAVEQALGEMNDYIADLDNSTVNGIETEIENVKTLLTALENETDEIRVIEVKLGDDIVVNEKLPARAICTDDRIAEDSHVVNISWSPSSVKAEEGKEYYAMVTLTPKDPENIKLGGTVQFEDKKFTIQENDGSGEFAAYHEGKLIIRKKFETSKSVLQSVSQPEERTVAWGSGTEALQLPNTIAVTTDVGDRNVDVEWNLDGVNLSDITKRDGYDLEVRGTLSLPANMTNPDEISTEVTVAVHVEADPNNAEIGLHVYGLKDKNEYKLTYGGAFPVEVDVTAGTVSVFSDDHRQETDWKTDDKKVKAGTVYQIITTLRPSKGAEFVEGRPIRFDGVTLNVESGNPENGKLEYAKKNEDGSLEVSRTYRSENAQLESADKVEDAAIAWNTEKTADAIGLPKTLGITTDDGRATAPSIEWDMDSMDYSASDINKRKAHTVTVKGKLAMPVDVNGEPAVDVPEEGMDIVTATVNVAADPRLEKEAAAAKLDSDAKKLIEEAKKLGVGAGEITRLQNELKAMNDMVSPDNLDKSTAESDQAAIDAVNTKLAALKKVVDDKKAADKKAEEDKKAAEEAARKAAEEKAANTVNEKKGIQPGANMKAVEKFLLKRKSDTDPAGSTVAPLKVKSTKQTKKSIKVRWAKAPGTAKYVLYGNECGKAKKLKKIKLLKGKTFNVKKIGGKKLKKGKYHKFVVIAYNAQNKVVAVSKYIHVATKGGKVGNHKRVDVKIKKGKKWKKIKKATVKAGKKLRLKGIAVKAGGKKIKVKKHRKVIFESSNPQIAKVTKKGVVKGVKKGKAKIHAYAQNGVLRTITVTVK